MADWDGAAPGYGAWWPTFERALRPILDEIVALAEVAPGHRVLDLGTGVGEPAATAARKVLPGGAVIAVDSSPEMLDAARARTAALGLDVTFLQGDAATMPLPGPFDAVLASYSLMFLPDLPTALPRFCAALRPAGRFVASVQRRPEDSPAAFGLPVRVAAEALGVPTDPHPSGLFALAEPATVRTVLVDAGFVDVRTQLVDSDYRWSGVGDFVAFLRDTCRPLAALLEGRSEEEGRRARAAIEEAAAGFVRADGSVWMPHQALVVVARRPG